jgi:type IV secretory pathway TrbD component
MILAYFNGIASSYLGFTLLEFIAVGVVILLVLVLVSLNRGGK